MRLFSLFLAFGGAEACLVKKTHMAIRAPATMVTTLAHQAVQKKTASTIMDKYIIGLGND
jgi:hypothetical protein